jgi:FAD binding domain
MLASMAEAPEIWNAAVPLRPAAVWRCANVGQVRDAVRRARAEGMALSVLGGGQDWAGRAVRDGAQVIDLSGMREVKVDGGVADATLVLVSAPELLGNHVGPLGAAADQVDDRVGCQFWRLRLQPAVGHHLRRRPFARLD